MAIFRNLKLARSRTGDHRIRCFIAQNDGHRQGYKMTYCTYIITGKLKIQVGQVLADLTDAGAEVRKIKKLGSEPRSISSTLVWLGKISEGL